MSADGAGEKTPILPSYYKAEMTHSESRSPKPMFMQKRKCIGCTVILVLIAAGVILILGIALGVGIPAGISQATRLEQSLNIDELMDMLTKLEETGVGFPNGSRSVLHGFNKSAEFVMEQLRDNGYEPIMDHFQVPVYENLAAPGETIFKVEQQSLSLTLVEGSQFNVMRYSGSCDIASDEDQCLGEVKFINSGSYGCESGDFQDTENDVVLLWFEHATVNCSLYEKAANAEEAGALAVVFMLDDTRPNSMPPTSRVFGGQPDEFVSIPVLGVTYQIGVQLQTYLNMPELKIQIQTSTKVTIADTFNVLALTKKGSSDSRIVVGSHLDSVPAGPGINDNGSGSIANLLLAINIDKLGFEPTNQVMFAFWGAEELGLLGSTHYVSSLSEEDRNKIALNINFDMIASPNFLRGVYNGAEADNDLVRDGSNTIQNLFAEYFNSTDKAFEFVPFTGRSDYGPFIAEGVNIPAGGLFTGAEQLKTADQLESYGGLENAPFDPCYHRSCDTIKNINKEAFESMARAAAYTLDTLMMKENLRDYLANPDDSE